MLKLASLLCSSSAPSFVPGASFGGYLQLRVCDSVIKLKFISLERDPAQTAVTAAERERGRQGKWACGERLLPLQEAMTCRDTRRQFPTYSNYESRRRNRYDYGWVYLCGCATVYLMMSSTDAPVPAPSALSFNEIN